MSTELEKFVAELRTRARDFADQGEQGGAEIYGLAAAYAQSLVDLSQIKERLANATTSLLALAEVKVDPAERDRIVAKAEGVQLALSYLHEQSS